MHGEDLLRQRLQFLFLTGREGFRHREPSCQLPQKKMGSPGTGVHVATTLGVLWFFFTGEGCGFRAGGGGGAPTPTMGFVEPLCLAGMGRGY